MAETFASDAQIVTGFATAIGHVRTRQEDRLLVAPPIIAVADGMGGLDAGDVAAEKMIGELESLNLDGSTAGARAEIKRAISRAERAIGPASGTTVVGAVLGLATAKHSWLVFHVGDSRMYSYVDGQLEALTTDHSLVQELVDTGVLSREEARYDPRRAIVTRAVGASICSEPAFRHVDAEGCILLACSDGITDELSEWEIEDIMGGGGSLDDVAQTLVDAALDASGSDNATAILARAFV
ncbi:PP2C family protein-serine/threonine phosphatase [Flaviflexus huanghaiensis]|uniref:PP2C family protein-serine/threonine phosphatase n=1 Tax=Flaviflexus huanghaiensis TaxID=1111473 RepID=UPI0015F859C8|nr:protein phosphatase 2C domain-containing protein [Flaviflexus huanghaiensis]